MNIIIRRPLFRISWDLYWRLDSYQKDRVLMLSKTRQEERGVEIPAEDLKSLKQRFTHIAADPEVNKLFHYLSLFMEKETVRSGSVSTRELWKAFVKYCERRGFPPPNMFKLFDLLSERGYEVKRHCKKGNVWQDLSLRRAS